MNINIVRINAYDDPRFTEKILVQHGAYLVENEPYEVEIIGTDSAIVHGSNPSYFAALIDEFRFYTEQITTFFNEAMECIARFPKVVKYSIALKDIQPSQFFVDEAKKEAVSSFISCTEDIIIPVKRIDGRVVSLDGHTRMAVAIEKDIKDILVFETEADEYIPNFVKEAQNRGVYSPYDLVTISHDEYEIKWNQFCDDFFSNIND